MEAVERNGLKFYQCSHWGKGQVHGFPTKLGGASQGDFAGLNLATGRGDEVEAVKGNYQVICDFFQVEPEGFARLQQVHGKEVHVVTLGQALKLEEFVTPNQAVLEGDGLLTQEKGIMLFAYSADCVPILYYDPVKEVIGAVHAGWRGTAAGIAQEMVLEMERVYGSRPADIQVAIGPSIGACCFMCSSDVPTAMRATLGEDAEPFLPPHPTEKDKFSVDLQGINQVWLQKAGVKEIDAQAPCTACHLDEFWSHRKQGEARGALGGFIYLPRQEEMG